MRYKTGQAAKLAGISPTTARVYARTFGDYFSQDARPSPGGTRFYTDDDIAILATIAQLRQDGRSDDEIQADLDAGERLERPPDATETAQEQQTGDPDTSALVTRLTATVAKFEGELTAVKEERDHLRKQLTESQEAHLVAEKEAAAANAKLEQIENQIAINVTHSQAVKDGGEDDRRPWYRRIFGG